MLNNHYSPKLGVRAFFNFIGNIIPTLQNLNLVKMQIPFCVCWIIPLRIMIV